eukprot:5955621-Amphidinium_carterae.1
MASIPTQKPYCTAQHVCGSVVHTENSMRAVPGTCEFDCSVCSEQSSGKELQRLRPCGAEVAASG